MLFMLFSAFKITRLAELLTEQWGAERIPDLIELIQVARPRSVLEIGCFRGVSTEVWLLHCASVIAVDPWPDTAVRRDFVARCGHYPQLEMIEGASPGALTALVDRRFDLCYIDGDHSYEAVMLDIAACRPLVRPGGYLGGHDYGEFLGGVDPGGDCPGVARAVHELLGKPEWRFSDGSWLVKL